MAFNSSLISPGKETNFNSYFVNISTEPLPFLDDKYMTITDFLDPPPASDFPKVIIISIGNLERKLKSCELKTFSDLEKLLYFIKYTQIQKISNPCEDLRSISNTYYTIKIIRSQAITMKRKYEDETDEYDQLFSIGIESNNYEDFQKRIKKRKLKSNDENIADAWNLLQRHGYKNIEQAKKDSVNLVDNVDQKIADLISKGVDFSSPEELVKSMIDKNLPPSDFVKIYPFLPKNLFMNMSENQFKNLISFHRLQSVEGGPQVIENLLLINDRDPQLFRDISDQIEVKKKKRKLTRRSSSSSIENRVTRSSSSSSAILPKKKKT